MTNSNPALKRWMKVPFSRTWPLRVAIGSLPPPPPPPHASHAGDVWERMIGVTQRILDSIFADRGPRHLPHEVLSTLMAEVTAIVNARPLIPVPLDPDMPEILTPATLLTQKSESLKSIPGNFTQQELYSKQWRQVQHLANVFWARWRKEFLPMLQPRRKWQQEVKNLQEGDLVLLPSKDLPRNCWPLARITQAPLSADGKGRKVWLCANKPSLNIDKTHFVIFHPYQKKLNYFMKIKINDKTINQHKSVKYLGILIDCHLNWKEHIRQISQKISRGIGILCKIRHYVDVKILVHLPCHYSSFFLILLYSLG